MTDFLIDSGTGQLTGASSSDLAKDVICFTAFKASRPPVSSFGCHIRDLEGSSSSHRSM